MENQQLKMELDARTKELKWMEECRNRWMDEANEMTRKFNALRDRTMEKLKYKFNVTILQNWMRKVIRIPIRSSICWDGVFKMKEMEIKMWERRYNNCQSDYYELEWKFEKFKQKKRKEKLMNEIKNNMCDN